MAPPPLVHPGERYGRLTVLHLTPRRVRRNRVSLCRCDCGGLTHVAAVNLRGGYVTSCGCARVDAARATGRKWGARNIATINAAK